MMYFSLLKNHIQKNIGKIPLKRISENDIKDFIAKETANYSPKTVHSVYSMLHLALTDAHERGYIGQIYSGIKLPKINNTVFRVLSPKEQKQLEKVLLQNSSRYDIGILLCLYTGLRIGELCALKWENIDLKNGTLSVLKTVQRIRNEDSRIKSKTMVFFAEPKSISSVRVIPVPEFMVDMLKKYRKENGFILRDDGRFTDTRNISRRFKKTLEIAGLPDMNFHILRHTFATRALELGIDVKTLSEILGHSGITITLNLYAHSLTEHKKKEMSKFNKLFKNPSN
jgi:integrase